MCCAVLRRSVSCCSHPIPLLPLHYSPYPSPPDFGLAVNHLLERPVTRLGTLDYMSPEVGWFCIVLLYLVVPRC